LGQYPNLITMKKIRKILYNAYSDFTWYFKSKYKKVKRVLYFTPIIWNGYDFDYSYAIELFEKQLERTAIFMESDQVWGLGAKDRASKIRTAISLLKKVYDGDYGLEYQDKLRNLYGDNVMDMVFTPTEDGKGSYLNWKFESWENSEEVQEVHDKLFKESRLKQKKAEDLVWRYIGHNIKNWWD